MKMLRIALAVLLVPATAWAEELPYAYRQFGFAPPQYSGGPLSDTERATLDSCIKQSRGEAESRRKAMGTMSTLYGQDMSQVDFFGVAVTGCLSDEKDGKGWTVQERRDDSWRPVRSRYAMRTFMKLDPNQ
jgi:hypothetical protein